MENKSSLHSVGHQLKQSFSFSWIKSCIRQTRDKERNVEHGRVMRKRTQHDVIPSISDIHNNVN